MKTPEEMTKAELAEAIKKKLSKASPMVKKVFFRGLVNEKKATLIRYLKKGRVVSKGIFKGDISFL